MEPWARDMMQYQVYLYDGRQLDLHVSVTLDPSYDVLASHLFVEGSTLWLAYLHRSADSLGVQLRLRPIDGDATATGEIVHSLAFDPCRNNVRQSRVQKSVNSAF